MSKNFRVLAVVACASLLFACKPQGSSNTTDASASGQSDAEKFGYAIGVDLGNSMSPVLQHIDIESLKKGLDDTTAANKKIADAKKALKEKKDAFLAKGGTETAANDDPEVKKAAEALAEAEKKPGVKMDDAAREQIKTVVAKQLSEEQTKARQEQASKAKEEGEKFLADNAKRPEVKTTASGLQYEVLKEGEGKNPTSSDEVTVHYRGTLVDGEEFDSSYSRGQPVTFPLGNVIPGWTEGVQLMKPGAKYKFYIPSNLGYGERGAGVKIGPNSTLIFEVELLSIGKPDDAAAEGSEGPAGGKPATKPKK